MKRRIRKSVLPIVIAMVLAYGALISGMHAGEAGSSRPFSDEVIYFLMVDRFNDADQSNNAGGFADASGRILLPGRDDAALSAAVAEHGYNPENFGYFQGGDFRGVRDKLDYIQGLGATAIWLSPVFKNKVTQFDSAGYHGYWILDFTTVDPHFGTEQDFRDLVKAAHARGLKVYLDIVVNHTADVIYYADNDYSFRLAPPHPPKINPADQYIKRPLWLNNPDYYHNLGGFIDNDPANPLYGASSLLGDFFGLDDLATEKPEVVCGMIDIYADWIRKYRIDGFRLDTAKHVDLAFWRAFCPAMLRVAREVGIPDFRIFGEVSDENGPDGQPAHTQRFLSEFMHSGAMPSVLDFDFRLAAVDFAARGGSPEKLRNFFAADGWYIAPGVSAHDLPTFLGNHDFGRIGYEIVKDQPAESRDDWLRRAELAHALMFFARGVPTLYSGDEQGFTGSAPGNDKSSRQPMFANDIPQYRGDPILGTDRKPGASHFDPDHPLYRMISQLAGLRRDNAALRRGAQVPRLADAGAGLFAFSRVCVDAPVEYVAVFNNATDSREGRIATYYPAGTTFRQIYPEADAAVITAEGGVLSVTLPALSARLYKAEVPVPAAKGSTPTITIRPPAIGMPVKRTEVGHEYVERVPLTADIQGAAGPGVMRFFARAGDCPWQWLGDDQDPPYAVFVDPSQFSAGVPVFFKAEYLDAQGNRVSVEGGR